MKVVILAGGFGTRMSEYTDAIPKPMVLIDDKPILWHVMKIYSRFGYNDFIIALGYKSEKIKDYFSNYLNNTSDLKIDLSKSEMKKFNTKTKENWKITLIDTGLNTMTGGRIKKIENFIKDENFMLTYGDGLANVNINKLVNFHKKHKKIATVTAVRPAARFGEFKIKNGQIIDFKEKPQHNSGWINGGFFILNKKIFKFIKNSKKEVFERSPLEKLVKKKELKPYFHKEFWRCIDSKRDLEIMQKLSKQKVMPWYK